jgi:hypothetical protein
LKLSPYRCARCDCRFLDTKISSGERLPLMTRAFDVVRSWVQRTPYDTNTALALNAILGPPSVRPERRMPSIVVEPPQAAAVVQGDRALN